MQHIFDPSELEVEWLGVREPEYLWSFDESDNRYRFARWEGPYYAVDFALGSIEYFSLSAKLWDERWAEHRHLCEVLDSSITHGAQREIPLVEELVELLDATSFAKEFGSGPEALCEYLQHAVKNDLPVTLEEEGDF